MSETLAASIAGFVGQSRPAGARSLPVSKLLAARRDGRQHYRCGIAPRLELAAERARSGHVGTGLMNLVFKPIEWASSWSLGRHRDRRLCLRGARFNVQMASARGPAVASLTRGHLGNALRSWSAPPVTINRSCGALTQQIAGGSVIFGGVAEGIGKDQGAGDG